MALPPARPPDARVRRHVHDAELQRNTDIVGLAPGWDDELRATGVTVAVLRPADPLAYALAHQQHWKVLHRSPALEELQAPPGW